MTQQATDTDLIQDIPVVRICSMRDAAILRMDEAIELLRRGHMLADEARGLA
jgi:hypothetical protein